MLFCFYIVMIPHAPTLILVSLLLSASGAAVLAYAARGGGRLKRLPVWFMSLQAGAYLVFMLRDVLTMQVALVVGHTALSAALAVLGEYAFQERNHRRWQGLIWLPVLFLAISLPLLMDQPNLRLGIIGAVYSAQCLAVVAILATERRAGHSAGRHILMAAVAIAGVALSIRTGAITGGVLVMHGITDDAPLHTIVLLATIVSLNVATVGTLLMNEERLSAELIRRERFEQFRSTVLDLLSRDAPLGSVLAALTSGVEQQHPDMICSIMLLEPDGRHLVSGHAGSLPAAFSAFIERLAIGPQIGSCGAAAFLGERVVAQDVATHPNWGPFRDLARSNGIGACWSQPIRNAAGAILGTFAIYHREPHDPDAHDIALIEQSARLASIAIERSREATELAESLERYRLIFEATHDGVCIIQDWRFRVVNPGFCQLLGYRPDELIGRALLDLVIEDDHELIRTNHALRLRGGHDQLMYAVRMVSKAQGVRWVEVGGRRIEWDGHAATLNFVRDIHERREAEERIRNLAFRDALTDLPNRRALEHDLLAAMRRQAREQRWGSLLFLDLDQFKPLNDTHGHDVGDRLLVEVAKRLNVHVRRSDTVARFGGDEFVVLLTNLDGDETVARQQMERIANEILAAITEPYTLPVGNDGRSVEHRCSTSIGAVMFMGNAVGVDAMMKAADEAMYRAKQRGGNRVAIAEMRSAAL